MPGSDLHRVSYFPRLIRDLNFDPGNISAPNEPAFVTVNLKGARPNMFFIVRTKPSVQSQVSDTPILAYCVTNNVIRVAYLGSETSGGAVDMTIIAL